MRRALTPVAVTAALLVAPSVAAAQLPPAPAPAPPPTPAPAAGKATIAVSGGMRARKVRYVARGGMLAIRGTVKPFVAGQLVYVELLRKKRVVARKAAPIGPGGRVSLRMKASRRGTLAVRLRHVATPQQAAFTSRKARVVSVVWSAGQGSRGTKVLLLQRGLARLHYAVPQTGRYDGGTSRAVLAFHKVNGQRRNGFADRGVFSAVLRGTGGFTLRYPKGGRHVEFDWSRQVLALTDKRGRVSRIYHASSGKPSTPTVFGSYRFYRKDPGTNSEGMVDSNYFIRGYAIHGYASVPNYAASHGCIRVPVPNARDIFNQVSLGERIFVYH